MIKNIILFGLPGTGKSYAQQVLEDSMLELDLGPDVLTKKQIEKLRKFNEQLCSKDIGVYSSYPQYFNLKNLISNKLNFVVVAIPKNHKDLILERMERRDDSGPFLNLYKKKFDVWLEDWLKMFEPFRNEPNVWIIEYYFESIHDILKTVLRTGVFKRLSNVSYTASEIINSKE